MGTLASPVMTVRLVGCIGPGSRDPVTGTPGARPDRSIHSALVRIAYRIARGIPTRSGVGWGSGRDRVPDRARDPDQVGCWMGLWSGSRTRSRAGSRPGRRSAAAETGLVAGRVGPGAGRGVEGGGLGEHQLGGAGAGRGGRHRLV